MVPNGWSIQKLEQIATVERGKFSARPRNDPKYFGGNIPFVQTGDIAAAKTYLQNYTQTLNEDGLKVSRLFPKDTILITIAANIGDTAITSFDVACPDSLVAIRTNKDTDCFWLKLYLETCKDELDGKATQNAQKNINLQVLKPLEVLTPPYPEQRKIAQILSTWDRGIATTEKLIDASKQQKKALMQQLLTGKKRLVDPETGKAFQGDWEATTISQLITESRLTGTNGELAKKITVKLYGRGVTKKEEKRLGSESTKYYKRKAGQFIYSKLDFLNGAFGIIPQSLDGYESTLDLPAFDFTPNVIPKWFIEFVSRDDFYTSNLGLANGGRKARRVNPKDLLQIKVRLPSIKEQQKISSVLTAADKEIKLLETKLAHLKLEKKSLMQQLLTGKRRVKVAETEAA
ncbi:TPA: restriction endonuclease subunit S [Vibrio campbellii]|nr:restriction endonuclease subunit S [Vibrio campbellii]